MEKKKKNKWEYGTFISNIPAIQHETRETKHIWQRTLIQFDLISMCNYEINTAIDEHICVARRYCIHEKFN